MATGLIDGVASSAAARYATLREEEATLAKSLEIRVSDLDVKRKAFDLMSDVMKDRREESRKSIEAMVTRALEVIFGPHLKFRLMSASRGGQASFDVVIHNERTGENLDPLNSCGGGVAQVVGFVLRVIALMMYRPRLDMTLLLDETFAMVSSEYRPKLAAFMREMVDNAGFRILHVTHDEEAFIVGSDKVYKVGGGTVTSIG